LDILATPEGFKRPKGFEKGVNNGPPEFEGFARNK
jgi:hypothetical protein